MRYVHNGMLFSHKKNEIMPFEAAWMSQDIIILSEVSWTENDKYHVIWLIWGIENDDTFSSLWEKARVGCFRRRASKHVYYLGWNRSPAQVGCMRQALGPGALGRPRGSGWKGRWERGSGWGTHVNPWLFHFNVWQNSLQKKKRKWWYKWSYLQKRNRLTDLENKHDYQREKVGGMHKLRGRGNIHTLLYIK